MGCEQGLSIAPQFKGFLKNSGKILNINSGPDVVFTTDLIYLRYATALALSQAAKSHMVALRAGNGDLTGKEQSIKSALELVLYASLRLFRLNRFHNAVFQGLGDSLRIFELNHKTALNFDLLLRINFASALVLKTFAASLNPEKYLFLSSACKITLENIGRIRPFFGAFTTKPFDSINGFLEIAEMFYRCMMLHIAMKLNIYEDKGLVKRTKDYKVNYVENQTMAKELLRLIGELEKKNTKGGDQFNVEANRAFAVAFIRKIAMEDADQ